MSGPPTCRTSPAFAAGEAPWRRFMRLVCAVLLAVALSADAAHAESEKHGTMRERPQDGYANAGDEDGAAGSGPDGGGGIRPVESYDFEGRAIDMYVPAGAPAPGARSLLVVLHGGMGNSAGVRRSLAMDGMADKYGFLVAYLNGTPSRIRDSMKTWNAGECCGLAQRRNVDDVGYITAAIHGIEEKYGVDPDRVYGLGHSNGAMMTQRMMCETGLYRAAVPISGPLELDTGLCPAARGKRIMAIHGTEDENVPIAGGRGKGIAGVDFRSEDDSRRIFEKSGSSYRLLAIPGADHKPASIRAAIARSGGSMSEDIVRFLGLAGGR